MNSDRTVAMAIVTVSNTVQITKYRLGLKSKEKVDVEEPPAEEDTDT